MTTPPLHRLADLVGGEVIEGQTFVGGAIAVGPDTISCNFRGGVWLAGPYLPLRKIGTLSDGPDVLAAAYRARVAERAA